VLLAIWYLAIWPGLPSIGHVILLGLLAMTLVERSLYQFRKIPFTCSWLPGGTQRGFKRGIWGIAFLFFLDMVGGFEFWSVGKPARLITIAGIAGALAIRSRIRTTEFSADPFNTLQFEDTPQSEIFALDLRQDGAWLGEEAYVDAIDPNFGRSLATRVRPFAIGFALLLIAGFLYEQTSEWRDHREFPQIGKSYDIGGRSLNLYCSGQGSQTVVFDSGGGQPGYIWFLVQPRVAEFTRACWYDRAGYGWSDAAPFRRTSADIADDLQKLLKTAGVPPPYILVGHSFGGFNVRLFASKYPGETAGLVLVDSADEFEDPELLPPQLQSPAQQYIPRSLWRAAAVPATFLVHIGVERLLDDGPGTVRPPMTTHDRGVLHAVGLQAKTFDATTWEGLDHDDSAAQVRAVRNLRNIPIVVLTAGRVPRADPDNPDMIAIAAYMQNRIYGTQAKLASLSTEGKQKLLPYSGHAIPLDAPLDVVNAVQSIWNANQSKRGN
jgi:pimeloyl-ACP methyl ester carboxylesterase